MPYIVAAVTALFLYCPAMFVISTVTPWKGFRIASVKHRGRRYKTLHLATLDRIGRMNRHQANKFHCGFINRLASALSDDSAPVYFTSHLLRPSHLRSMKMMLSATATYRWHCRSVTIPRGVRVGIRMQILLQEWRWITVPASGVLVVIRPRA